MKTDTIIIDLEGRVTLTYGNPQTTSYKSPEFLGNIFKLDERKYKVVALQFKVSSKLKMEPSLICIDLEKSTTDKYYVEIPIKDKTKLYPFIQYFNPLCI